MIIVVSHPNAPTFNDLQWNTDKTGASIASSVTVASGINHGGNHAAWLACIRFAPGRSQVPGITDQPADRAPAGILLSRGRQYRKRSGFASCRYPR